MTVGTTVRASIEATRNKVRLIIEIENEDALKTYTRPGESILMCERRMAETAKKILNECCNDTGGE